VLRDAPIPVSVLLAAAFLGAGVAFGQPETLPPAPADPAPTAEPDAAPATGETPAEPAGQQESPPPSLGDEVSIIFATGQRAEGVLVAMEPGLYVVRIGGLDVRLRPSDIESMVSLPSIEERFAQMQGLVPPNDAKALLALAAWAEARDLLPRALGVVEQALDIEPHNGDALRAKAVLERQIELKRLQREQGDRGVPDADPEPAAPPVRDLIIRQFPMLTEDQVNLIKVMEVDLSNPPRMVIDPETVEILLRTYADHPAMPVTRAERDAFRRAPAHQILDMMFRVGARELYNQVKVIGHPEAMRAFRDRVNAAWLTNAVATTRCHGGTAGGRLLLQNRKPSAPESFYTNFLILERFRTSEGDGLIDYARPDRSVLLEMGLPREESIYPHPDVPGWKPIFRTRDDRAYQRTVEWIRMMYQPRPLYPIEYTPPGEVGDAPGDVEKPAPVVR
jgi:hypothetical protein